MAAKKKDVNNDDNLLFINILYRYKANQAVKLRVQVCAALFRNEDSGWSIYTVEMEDRQFKISGAFASPLRLGWVYDIDGKISDYNNERQVVVNSINPANPENKESIIRMLQTIDKLNISAHAVYKKYGKNIIADIRNNPEKVADVLGYSLSEVLSWNKVFNSGKETNEAFEELRAYYLKDSECIYLLKEYGIGILDSLRTNPYILIELIDRIGFKRCDAIAIEKGIPYDDLYRIQSAIIYAMTETAYSSGDCYIEESQFFDKVTKMLDIKLNYREAKKLVKESTEDTVIITVGALSVKVKIENISRQIKVWESGSKSEPFSCSIMEMPKKKVLQSVEMLMTAGKITKKQVGDLQVYYLTKILVAEETAARNIYRLVNCTAGYFSNNQSVVEQVCKDMNVVLERRQMEAAIKFTSYRGGFFIMNGSAGCGKTFVLKIILETLKRLYAKEGKVMNTKILAPTGKAAKVANKTTKYTSVTIHRELGYTKSGESRVDNVMYDVLIIDEFSMVDIFLASSLFAHISNGTKVIILGDTDQLPSIGPGSVLRDMLECKKLNVVTLDVVKRQGKGSYILENANNILAGKPICNLVKRAAGDAHVIIKDTVYEQRQMLLRLFRRALDIYPLMDVQMLCPQRTTDVGVDAMNYCIQQTVNPAKPGEITVLNKQVVLTTSNGQKYSRDLVFRIGDKVIHTKNDYDKKWMKRDKRLGIIQDFEHIGIINGETGIICDIQKVVEKGKKTKYRIYVEYEDGIVSYVDDIMNLEHDYAITIHKAQGSQWPVVLSPISSSNYWMMNRNLLYTLYTRAQHLSFVVGNKSAMDRAVSNTSIVERKTGLAPSLSSCFIV